MMKIKKSAKENIFNLYNETNGIIPNKWMK